MTILWRALPWLLAAVLFAALTHFVAVLLVPKVATKDAFSRLARIGANDHMVILPPADPSDTLVPFRDPSTVQGICFFDVSNAPVRVRTHVEEGRLLTLSFRTREGRIFYAMTDRAALRGTIDIRLVSDPQLRVVEAADDEDQGLPTELRLQAPSPSGLVVVTTLIERPDDRADAEARIKAVTCRPEPLGGK